jgi:hypothetical protein
MNKLRRSLTLAPLLMCACANRECCNCTAPWLNVNKLENFCLTPRCNFIWGKWRKVRFGDCHIVATLDACDDITRVNACAHIISYYAMRCALVLTLLCPVCWQRTCAPSHFQTHIIQNNSPSPQRLRACAKGRMFESAWKFFSWTQLVTLAAEQNFKDQKNYHDMD